MWCIHARCNWIHFFFFNVVCTFSFIHWSSKQSQLQEMTPKKETKAFVWENECWHVIASGFWCLERPTKWTIGKQWSNYNKKVCKELENGAFSVWNLKADSICFLKCSFCAHGHQSCSGNVSKNYHCNIWLIKKYSVLSPSCLFVMRNQTDSGACRWRNNLSPTHGCGYN